MKMTPVRTAVMKSALAQRRKQLALKISQQNMQTSISYIPEYIKTCRSTYSHDFSQYFSYLMPYLLMSHLKYSFYNTLLMTSRQIPFDLVIGRTLKGGIGKNNKLPWKLPSDLKMFKKITTSGPHKNSIIMGRKTFQSISSKPLPNRLNIIVSKDSKIAETENVRQARSLQDALDLSSSEAPKGKAFVIGGAKIFEDSLADCRYVYETLIADDVPCDVFAPKYDHLACSYVSKTFRENQLRFDYRQYYNQSKYGKPQENLFGQPEHEQYQYIRAIKKIIGHGQQKDDRTGTGTKALFGEMMRYDLSQTFPLLTHKKVFWRGVAEELLWFIKGSTNANELEEKNIKIWAGNSSKEYLNSIGIDREAGDLGPVYGFQWRHWNAPYVDMNTDYTGKGIDQLQWVINEIKRNPSSRRLIISAWNPSQLPEMALPPCHLLSQFQVSNSGKLNCILYQRSCDMGLGVPFNIASYALLTCLIAQVTGLQRGQFIHMLADMHVYNDHIESLKQLETIVPYPFPYLEIDPSISKIDDFRFEHLKLHGYTSHKKIEMKMSV